MVSKTFYHRACDLAEKNCILELVASDNWLTVQLVLTVIIFFTYQNQWMVVLISLNQIKITRSIYCSTVYLKNLIIKLLLFVA